MITLYSYQKDVVSFMKNIEKQHYAGGMICLDMGLGKTMTSMELIYENIEKVKQTLIIVPKTLLKTWEDEYEKYMIGRDKTRMSMRVYYRINLEKAKFDENVIITTYEHIKTYYKFVNHQFGRIILDESQNIRNHKNKISKQILNLKGLKKWCLSGTPFFNDYSDMYAQCLFIGLAPFNDKKKWKYPTEEFLNEFRNEYCYILKKEDVKDDRFKLPEIIHHKVNVELNEKEIRIYNKLKKMLNEGGNTLNYLIKIRQACCNVKVMTKVDNNCSICTCFTMNEYKCGHYICQSCNNKKRIVRKEIKKRDCLLCEIDSTKFEKIDNILKSIPKDEKMVIFTQWKSMGILLKKYFKKKYKVHMINGSVNLDKRNDIINKFKEDDRRILIATIQTCGTGIDFTRANHVVLVDNWWNASLEKQAIDRLYRNGQIRETHVYHVIIENAIERWINFKQRQKKIQSKILFENDNEVYKWIGESYGIYSTKRRDKTREDGIKRVRRYYSDKTMSRLNLNSCLDREHKSYSYDDWEIINKSANVIQRFYKKYIKSRNEEVSNFLIEETNMPKDICEVIADYTYSNMKEFRRRFKL
jgi:SNF2 family DNA or RNA helicase